MKLTKVIRQLQKLQTRFAKKHHVDPEIMAIDFDQSHREFGIAVCRKTFWDKKLGHQEKEPYMYMVIRK